VLKPGEGIHVPYFAHLFKSHPYIQSLRTTSEFIRDGQDLTFSNFCDVPLPVVPPDEQKAIAGFLDAHAAKVRRFIRNRLRLIKVLNEQKQAIINRAITRGVTPNTPLKPSGVDLLDNIPEHWIVKPLKRWVSINALALPESTDPDFLFDYLDIGCVGTGLLVEKPARIRFADAPSRARRVLRTGDTIISTVRTYLRAVYFFDDAPGKLVASTGFAVLTPSPEVLPELLGIALQSDPFINRVTVNSIGIAYPAIAETRLAAFPLALPPSKSEQARIVEHVRKETRTMTEAILHAQREIDLIREYCTRLIADVVTGKVDVRHLAPDEPVAADQEPDEGIKNEEMLGDDDPEPVEEAADGEG
jgi:type I restriction enzyme S subunit